MINTRELRIGNLVHCDTHVVESPAMVTGIETNAVSVTDGLTVLPEIVYGVPLTEEILVKMGFACFGNEWKYKEYWIPYLVKKTLHNSDAIWWQVYNVADCSVVYVHQLQNLFFSLTGQELSLNLQ